MASTTIGAQMPTIRADARLRTWLLGQVRGQQAALGDALEDAGVVKNGQAWVSKYVNNGPAIASVDHLLAIAAFFERTLSEMLMEAGVTSAVMGGDQRSGTGGSTDVPASEQVRILADRIKKYEATERQLQDALGILADVALAYKKASAGRSTDKGSADRRKRRTGT